MPNVGKWENIVCEYEFGTKDLSPRVFNWSFSVSYEKKLNKGGEREKIIDYGSVTEDEFEVNLEYLRMRITIAIPMCASDNEWYSSGGMSDRVSRSYEINVKLLSFVLLFIFDALSAFNGSSLLKQNIAKSIICWDERRIAPFSLRTVPTASTRASDAKFFHISIVIVCKPNTASDDSSVREIIEASRWRKFALVQMCNCLISKDETSNQMLF